VSIGSKVIRGGLLLLVGQFAVRAIRVGSLAVLGRLLAPSDYGVFALALVVTGLFDLLSDLQISAAIIRMRKVEDHHFDTAFLISFCRGLGVAAAVFFSAPLAAHLLGDVRLESMLRWLALPPLIGAFTNPRFILYERDLNFKAEFSIVVISSVLGTLLTIAFGLALRNYWALVYGAICSSVINVAFPYFFVRYRPRFSTDAWREFLSFGGWLTLANLVSYINYRSDVVLVGRFLGDVKLGYYSMGDRISQVATNELVQPFARAFYPGLATVAHDPQRLRAAYYKAQQVVLALVLPVGVATAIGAKQLVLLMAGPKWLPSVMMVQILAPLMALSVMSSAVQALVMSAGTTRSIFIRNLVNLIVRVPMMVAGLWLGGLFGLIISRAFTGMVFTFSTLALARGQTGDPFWQPFIFAWRSLAATVLMAAAMLGALALIGPESGAWYGAALHLAILGAVGAPVYGLAHWAIWLLAGRPDGVEALLMQQVGNRMQAIRPAGETSGDS